MIRQEKATFQIKAMSLSSKKHPFDPLSTRYCAIKASLYLSSAPALGGGKMEKMKLHSNTENVLTTVYKRDTKVAHAWRIYARAHVCLFTSQK